MERPGGPQEATQGPLSRHLHWWQDLLAPSHSLRPIRLLFRLLGSKLWLLTVSVAPMTMLLGLFRAETLFGATDAIIYTSCFYSSATGNGVLIFRRQRIIAILDTLRGIATVIEVEACEAGQRALVRAGVYVQRLTNVQLAFTVLDLVAAWAQIVLTFQPLAPMWPPLPGHWGHIFECGFQGVVETTGTFAYISLICIIGCMVISLSGLYHAVGLRLRTARGDEEVLFFVRMHQRLLEQGVKIDHLFHDVLGHLMVVTFVAPLLSTLKIVRKANITDFSLFCHKMSLSWYITQVFGPSRIVLFTNLDSTLFNSLLLFSVVFGPLALMSQDLTDASLALGDCAYAAAFEQDGGAVGLQRTLAVVSHMSSERPPHLSIKGFGVVSIPGAAATLKIWYQWANLIIGITTK